MGACAFRLPKAGVCSGLGVGGLAVPFTVSRRSRRQGLRVSTLKSACFYLNRFDNIEQLQADIRYYIHYYNHERIKTKLKGLSLVQYRNQALAA